MKTTLKTKTAGEIIINSEYIGNKQWDADEKNNNYHNHIISVIYKGHKLSFDFWGSIMNPEIKNDQENAFSFYCFLSDSLSSSESFKDFCSNFGYNEDSRKAEKIYKLCKKSLKKYEKLFNGVDLCDLLNEIQEKYDC